MELWEHQKKAIATASFRDYYALFFEMGTGKTRTVLEILKTKIAKTGKPLKTLIVSPLVVVPNWSFEASQWVALEVTPLLGSQKKRIQTFLYSLSVGQSTFSINYEGLLMKDLFLRLKMWCPDVPARATPVLARCWSKDAEPLVEDGRLVPWDLEVS